MPKKTNKQPTYAIKWDASNKLVFFSWQSIGPRANCQLCLKNSVPICPHPFNQHPAAAPLSGPNNKSLDSSHLLLRTWTLSHGEPTAGILDVKPWGYTGHTHESAVCCRLRASSHVLSMCVYLYNIYIYATYKSTPNKLLAKHTYELKAYCRSNTLNKSIYKLKLHDDIMEGASRILGMVT